MLLLYYLEDYSSTSVETLLVTRCQPARLTKLFSHYLVSLKSHNLCTTSNKINQSMPLNNGTIFIPA